MSTSYHHGDLRAALIEAGLGLLREGGAAALTLRAAARAANVSAMAPYRHFADKEALLAAIAGVGFARLAAKLAAADSAADPLEALRAQGIAYVKFAVAEPELFRLMFGARRSRKPVPHENGGTAYTVLERRVASLAPEAEREALTLTCWSLVHGLAALIVDGQISDDAAMLAATVTGSLGRLFPITPCRS